MSNIDRRDFLKILGVGAIVGIWGGSFFEIVNKRELEASIGSYKKAPEALQAKKWAMVIDIKKLNKKIINDCIEICHSIHNVPTIANPKEEIKWIWEEKFKNVFPEIKDQYLSYELMEMPVLVLCNHCDNPPCVRVCPTKATFKRKDGIVMMDMHRCIGCRFCMAGCPYGARSFNWRDPRQYIKNENKEFPFRMKGVVEKCTFCYERLARGLPPACVEVSQGAIVFGDIENPESAVRKILSTNLAIRRKPKLGTNPSVYYLL